jgi:hypothetical protein
MDGLVRAYASSPLLFWVLGSVTACALGTNLLWLLRSTGIQTWPAVRGLQRVVQFLFYLGVPYLALGGWPRDPFQGTLSLEDLGIVGLSARWPPTRWLSAAGTALGVGFVAFLLLVVARANAGKVGTGSWLRFPHRPWWAILVEVIYLQVHWAFYRAALALSLDTWTSAILFGLGLVYLEWSLNPFWRQAWHSEAHAAATWLRASLALLAALVYLLTRNLWACLAVHLLFETAFRRLVPAPAPVRTG